MSVGFGSTKGTAIGQACRTVGLGGCNRRISSIGSLAVACMALIRASEGTLLIETPPHPARVHITKATIPRYPVKLRSYGGQGNWKPPCASPPEVLTPN